MPNKVALAVSGGIDSAIAAIKLKEMGLEVVGVHFLFWKWENDTHDSRNNNQSIINDISKKINFNIFTIDYQKEFKETIVDKFILELLNGMTPNPCVICNPMIKFFLLKRFADQEKIENISTGHYARVKRCKNNYYSLMKGVDIKKDQSYVLFNLTQEILARTIFPLGDTYKTENFYLANQLGLESGKRRESQDLCFVTPNHYQQFIKESLPVSLKKGDVVDLQGNKLGEHDGLAFYTIGQRKGIKLSAKKPYYVIKKELLKNHLVVGHLEEMGNRQLIIEDVNWIIPGELRSVYCDVKIRYQSIPIQCKVEKGKGMKYIVSLEKAVRDITPGQYAVFYEGEQVLGGGKITEIISYYE